MPSRSEVLIAAYLARYNLTRRNTGIAVGRLWDRYALVDDDAAFVAAAVIAVEAGQRVTFASLLGYLSALFVTLGEDPVDQMITAEESTGAAVRANVDPAVVYGRGIVTARTALSKGSSLVAAMAAGRARMVSTAETDVALTQRSATVRALETSDRVIGYRRVLTGKSCALCQIASTQRYRTSELMPIHNHCDCGVVPIIGTKDPGQVINRELLRDLKSRGEIDKVTRQRALPKARQSLDNARKRVDDLRVEIQAETDQERETRLERRLDKWQQEVARREERVATLTEERKPPQVAVREHGELGPVLTQRDHNFTGEGDLAA